MNYAILALFLVALKMLDVFLTKTALSLGAGELNPVWSKLGTNYIIHLTITLFVIVVLYDYKKEYLLRPLCIGMLIVVIYNMVAILSWV